MNTGRNRRIDGGAILRSETLLSSGAACLADGSSDASRSASWVGPVGGAPVGLPLAPFHLTYVTAAIAMENCVIPVLSFFLFPEFLDAFSVLLADLIQSNATNSDLYARVSATSSRISSWVCQEADWPLATQEGGAVVRHALNK